MVDAEQLCRHAIDDITDLQGMVKQCIEMIKTCLEEIERLKNENEKLIQALAKNNQKPCHLE